MGMSIYGNLVYGVTLDEDTWYKLFGKEDAPFYNENGGLEELDSWMSAYKSRSEFPNLTWTISGNYDYPHPIIIHYDKHGYSSYWGDLSVVDNLDPPDNLDELREFCHKVNINFKPKWYLSAYYSY